MVDFQSRDTDRGLGSSDDEDEDVEEVDEGDEQEVDEGDEDAVDEGAEDEVDDGAEHEPPAGAAGESQDGTADGSAVSTGGDTATSTEDGVEEHEHADEDGHAHDHHHHGDRQELGVAVVTVSSSRTRENDPSGDAIAELLVGDDHDVVTRDVVADDLDGIQRAVLALTAREDVDVVVTTGGTGVTPDDVTIEAVKPLLDKDLPGFGELFRIRSYESVGTRALGTRATAGISEGVPIFCLPGSEDAVRLGTEELLLPEVGHLVGLADPDD